MVRRALLWAHDPLPRARPHLGGLSSWFLVPGSRFSFTALENREQNLDLGTLTTRMPSTMIFLRHPAVVRRGGSHMSTKVWGSLTLVTTLAIALPAWAHHA